MKNLLSSMNLERWIIAVALISSAVLAFTGYRLRRQRIELEASLDTKVPLLAQSMLVHSQEFSRLDKEADREGLKGGQADPQSYVRRVAGDPKVAIGSISFVAQPERETRKGVKDKRYVIAPQDPKKSYRRENIARFLWFLESESRRVKVTRAVLERADRNPEPSFIGEDLWTWEADLTSRVKAEEKKAIN